ncbi:MarR family winged helix-turn-helix transcriptional regulator [Glaciimonas sp. PAMC28666]|uniref:MarR family winged helix-turn-helix transcriptional regulator n=1 Tax=Glaciimonas sp. PAMC28666 TaxID=2807626 RepID=UPI001F0343C6|nr:MarR family transcriptional regulator [Glaciimonas sp. PAMC28666]
MPETLQQHDRDLMHLTMSLGQITRAYKVAADQNVSYLGLSQATAWPLVMIARLGNGVRPGSVADALGLDPASVVRVIDHLIAAKLVERREDPTDRRAKLLYLTDEGSCRVLKLEAALLPFRRQLFTNIDSADIDACLRVFDALSGALATCPARNDES